MFKFQSASKYSPFDAIRVSRLFSTAQKFLNSSMLMLFSASAVFCFTSSTSAKLFPLGTFFIQGTKKVTRVGIRWIGRMGHGGHAVFDQKLLNDRCGVGRCARKSPIVKWANTLKGSSKKSHSSQKQPLTTMPAGTDTDGFLEHPPSWEGGEKGSLYCKGPALQKVIPACDMCPPSYVVYLRTINRYICKVLSLFKNDAQLYRASLCCFYCSASLIVTDKDNLIMTLYCILQNSILGQIFQGHFW